MGNRRRTGAMRAVAAAWLGLAVLGAAPDRAQPPGAVVRPAAVAGSFYPADAARLRAAIEGLLREAVPPRTPAPRLIVAPHAGYSFSGQIAADAFAQVRGVAVDTVVILGANHTTPGFSRVSVWDGDAWQTPLGRVPVDRELAQALVAADAGAVFEGTLHAKEHSVEVHVPFVQVLFPDAAILPVVVGSPDPSVCRRLGRALAALAATRSLLIVASSDLAHYPDAAQAARLDREMLEYLVTDLDGHRLVMAEADVSRAEAFPVPGLATRACGLGPLLVIQEVAKQVEARQAAVVSYANSAEAVPGSRDRVVGYGAVSFAPGPAGADTTALRRPKADAETPLDQEDRRSLLRLARESIAAYLAGETMTLPRGGSARLLRERGAFVTLKSRGELRGCIGRVMPDGPLLRVVSAVALESALADPRFSPVRQKELAGLDIEVSVLTRPREIASANQIEPGRDGVVFRLKDKGAVFLPYVATEQGWTRTDLLENLAVKAGLAPMAWRDRQARFEVFQADTFSESSLKR